jgi:hypothetical protein
MAVPLVQGSSQRSLDPPTDGRALLASLSANLSDETLGQFDRKDRFGLGNNQRPSRLLGLLKVTISLAGGYSIASDDLGQDLCRRGSLLE